MPATDDWDTVATLLSPGEERVALCHAWAPGGLVGDSADHPCVVYLTSEAVMIDVRPQTLLEKPATIHMGLLDIMRWGAERHPGGLRLMLVARPPVSEEIAAEMFDSEPGVSTAAVDLPNDRSGKRFVKHVERTLGRDRRWQPGG